MQFQVRGKCKNVHTKTTEMLLLQYFILNLEDIGKIPILTFMNPQYKHGIDSDRLILTFGLNHSEVPR